MKATTVRFEDERIAQLELVAAVKGWSLSEAVQQAVDLLLTREGADPRVVTAARQLATRCGLNVTN